MDHNRNKYKSSENAAVDLPDAIPEVEMYEDDDLKAFLVHRGRSIIMLYNKYRTPYAFLLKSPFS